MKGVKLFSLFVLLLCGIVAYFLYSGVESRFHEKRYVKQTEKRVKQKLLAIRDAQTSFLSSYNRYAKNWNELESYVADSSLYLVDVTEHVITLSYGADSVWFTKDTVGKVPVKDSLFKASIYTDDLIGDLSALPHAPEKDFELFATDIDGVQVFEVVDTEPVNPDRISGHLPPLTVGSRIQATTKGNWEK